MRKELLLGRGLGSLLGCDSFSCNLRGGLGSGFRHNGLFSGDRSSSDLQRRALITKRFDFCVDLGVLSPTP
jgi:hypothetical protein